MVSTPNKAFHYPKNFNNMFHYPAPLDGAVQPQSITSTAGQELRHDKKSKQHQHKDFNPASFDAFLDGADLVKGERFLCHNPHQKILPSRKGHVDLVEKNNMSLDHILEHVQEWKTEFGITNECEAETHHRSAQEFERPDLVPASPTSHTSCTTGAGSRMSSSSSGRYDVTRSLRRKGTGPAAAAATLLSHGGITKAPSRRGSNGGAPLGGSDSPESSREGPERSVSFSQLAARQRKTSFSELAAQRGVKW